MANPPNLKSVSFFLMCDIRRNGRLMSWNRFGNSSRSPWYACYLLCYGQKFVHLGAGDVRPLRLVAATGEFSVNRSGNASLCTQCNISGLLDRNLILETYVDGLYRTQDAKEPNLLRGNYAVSDRTHQPPPSPYRTSNVLEKFIPVRTNPSRH